MARTTNNASIWRYAVYTTTDDTSCWRVDAKERGSGSQTTRKKPFLFFRTWDVSEYYEKISTKDEGKGSRRGMSEDALRKETDLFIGVPLAGQPASLSARSDLLEHRWNDERFDA